MSLANQNHAIAWVMFLGRLIQHGNMKLYAPNPRIYLMNQYAGSVFIVGRDTNKEPFLGVPLDFTPFFLQMDWCSASICRNDGFLFLEARDPRTQVLNFALGIRIRKARLNTICIDKKENPDNMVLNMKVFEQDPVDIRDLTFSDRHDVVGIPIREIDGIEELSNEFESGINQSILERSGVDESFTVKRLDLL